VRITAHKQKPKPACWRHHNGSCVTLAVLGNSRAALHCRGHHSEDIFVEKKWP
jgi:hypothetical protein